MTSTNKLRRMLRREYPSAELGHTGTGHIRLRFPNGDTVVVASTASDHRFLKNVRTTIRRLGRKEYRT